MPNPRRRGASPFLGIVAAVRPWVAAASVAATLLLAGPAAPAAGQVPLKAPGKKEPPAATGYLLEWLVREQMADGGWHFRGTRGLPDFVHARKPPKRPWGPVQTYAGDTAMAALALLRAGHAPGRGRYAREAKLAADYLYAAAAASGDGPTLSQQQNANAPRYTPFALRVGPHVTTALTLLYFAELRDPAPNAPRPYDAEIAHLVRKLERNQRPDGAYGDADHAPLLGQAVAVWALESAVRHGVAVDAAALQRAESYAMSEEAERADLKANGKWKVGLKDPRPEWLKQAGADDDEPIDTDGYRMAARLSVLYQADRTNRWAIDREWERLKAVKAAGKQATEAELAALRDMLAKAKVTQDALDQGRDAIRRSWGKVHKDDLHPAPAPILFTAEDFLADLLVVDAMGQQADVQQWFLPMARRLIFLQDMDGGLRTQEHVRPKRDWCSLDRTFITAAGLMMLAADTPYKPTVLNPEPPKGAAARAGVARP